jgi:hypothetical protein
MENEKTIQDCLDAVESAGPALAPADAPLAMEMAVTLEEARKMLDASGCGKAWEGRMKTAQKVKLCELVASGKIKYREAEFLMQMLFGTKDENNMELQKFFASMNKINDGSED